MRFQASDVGPIYDIGLSTRDGLPLTVQDRNGNNVDISELAFCLSTQQQAWHEETELMHKGTLVQLSSPNLSDREFDQWPQSTQGDWSGGIYQRILTDQSRYYDGQGLIWPTNDWLPQQPVLVEPAQPPRFSGPGVTDIAGGALGEIDAQAGYAFTWTDGSTNQYVSFQSGDTLFSSAANPYPHGSFVLRIWVAAGNVLVLAEDLTTYQVRLYFFQNQAGALVVINPGGTLITADLNGASTVRGLMTAGPVADKLYCAIWLRWDSVALSTSTASLFLIDFTDVPNAGPVQTHLNHNQQTNFTDMRFFGDFLYIAQTDQARGEIIGYDIVGARFFSVAQVLGQPWLYFVPVGGAIFVLAVTSPLLSLSVYTVDMYLLNGSTLAHIGPLNLGATYFDSVSRPVAIGPYAFWEVSYDNFVSIFAYDVASGRLFRAFKALSAGTGGIDTAGYLIGAVPGTLRTIGGIQYPFQFAVVGVAGDFWPDGTFPIELWFAPGEAVASGANQIRGPVEIVSSQIDFTVTALPKRYRQLLAQHDPLSAAGQSVTLKVWLNQDPAHLSASPDYQVTHSYLFGDPFPGITTLPINALAYKLVYELVTTRTLPSPAPAVYSVATQVSTGRVQTLLLDLAFNAMANDRAPGKYVFDSQGTDQVAAYNFLWALWEQRGGQCIVTLPGWRRNWLIQDMHFDSPKPLALSFRADRQTSMESLVQVHGREDV